MSNLDKSEELQNLIKQDPQDFQLRRELAVLLIDCGYNDEAAIGRQEEDKACVHPAGQTKAIKKKPFTPPTLEEWLDFCREKNLNLDKMRNAYEGYVAADWHDTQGSPIRNWKQKILMVWASRPDNYNTQTANFARPTEMEKFAKGAKIAEAMLKKQGII